MKHLPFRAWLTAATACFFIAKPVARAQSPSTDDGKQSHHTGIASAAPAHVRFWKTDLQLFPVLKVSFLPATGTPKPHAAARELGGGGPGYLFNNYTDMPAGRGTLEVYDPTATVAAGKKPTQPHALVSLPVDLAPGSFVTVLLDEPRKPGAPPQIDAIIDGQDGEAAATATAQINVRNFVTGLQDVHVTFGDNLSAQFTGGNNFLQMRGLKPMVYQVHTTGTGVDGKPFEWVTEADLRQHHHQSLLIYPDPYGRVRPRMSVDGETLVEPGNEKEEQR